MKHIISVATVLIVAFVLGNHVTGQTAVATISGTVSDTANHLIPGVTITLLNQDTKTAVRTLTGDRGDFQCSNIRPGPYELSASLQGLQTATVSNIAATGGRALQFSIVMKVESSRSTAPNNKGQIKDLPGVGECR